MKCAVCNYEFEIDYSNSDGKIIKGDEEFIMIRGNFTYEERFEYESPETHYINLYGCPKCGTVRMEI